MVLPYVLHDHLSPLLWHREHHTHTLIKEMVVEPQNGKTLGSWMTLPANAALYPDSLAMWTFTYLKGKLI